MWSHHSHSGQYCNHAQDSLEDIVLEAIRMGFTKFALTEHMHRQNEADLYPDELEKGIALDSLERLFAAYFIHARDIKSKYKHKIEIFVGFEIEYIRLESLDFIKSIIETFCPDFIVGSIHHVGGIPIDYNQELWTKAMQKAGGSEEMLYAQYFDEQFSILQELRPAVVGHFDLIRLFAPDSKVDFQQWPVVWQKITRNISFISDYEGLVEINSSSLRKGWDEPYPRRDIAQLVISCRGRFTLSDDCHSIAHVGLNYHKVKDYVQSLGISELYCLNTDENGQLEKQRVALSERWWKNDFWTRAKTKSSLK